MSLHDDIQNHINDLQKLLNETTEPALIKKARELWGKEDYRFKVLKQFVASSGDRFAKPADPPAPEPSGGQDNKPVQKSAKEFDKK